jgi:hypothetical protein
VAQQQTEATKQSWPQRLKRSALFALFATILLVPKFLGLRRRPLLWNALRFVVALIGAFLIADKTGSLFSLFSGFLLFVLALAVRPAKQEKSVDEQARELGALIALNGGQFCATGEKPRPVRLFVASERLQVLDLAHRPLLEIAWSAISSVRAEAMTNGWRLLVAWNESGQPPRAAEFHYGGFFAEHLARTAETTLRDQLRRELPLVR